MQWGACGCPWAGRWSTLACPTIPQTRDFALTQVGAYCASMRSARTDAAEARVAHACRTAKTPVALQQEVQAALSTAVPVDRWCGMVFDPATVLPTAGYHEEGLPPALLPTLLEIEHAGVDVNLFCDLARTRTGAGTLAGAVRNPESSPRYREVLQPAGLPHELRVVLRAGNRAWGALVLLRGEDRAGFSGADLALAAKIAPAVAVAVRRLVAVNDPRTAVDIDGPGLVLVSGRDDLEVLHATQAGRRWLAEIDDGSPLERLPYSLSSLVATARAPEELTGRRERRLRMLTRSGRWLTVHAERFGEQADAPVSLILEPSRPHEVAGIIAAAYGLTAREAETATLTARGLTTEEIAQAMYISRHTVRDHLKHALDKTGTSSRAELTAKLFFDQYLPRSSTGSPVGADGWFIT